MSSIHIQAIHDHEKKPYAKVVLRDEDPNTDEHTVELVLDSDTGVQMDKLDPNQHRILEIFHQIVDENLKLLKEPEKYTGTGPVEYSSNHDYWRRTAEVIRSSNDYEIPGLGTVNFTETSAPSPEEIDTDPGAYDDIVMGDYGAWQHAEISTPAMPRGTSIFVQDRSETIHPPAIQEIAQQNESNKKTGVER